MEGTAFSPGREETPGRTIHININDRICCSFLCSKHCAFHIISFNLYSLLKNSYSLLTDKPSIEMITKSLAQGMQCVRQKSRDLDVGLSDTRVQALEPGISGDWRWGISTADSKLHSKVREASLTWNLEEVRVFSAFWSDLLNLDRSLQPWVGTSLHSDFSSSLRSACPQVTHELPNSS